MNTISLIALSDKRIQTDITIIGGSSVMEIHGPTENDEKVLIKLSRNKYYRKFPGEWELHLPQDSQKFAGKEFTDVTSKALAFINERDNPNIYVVNYF